MFIDDLTPDNNQDFTGDRYEDLISDEVGDCNGRIIPDITGV